MNIAAVADRLHAAAQDAAAIPQLTATDDLDVATAYQVQAELVRRRRGERPVGGKML